MASLTLIHVFSIPCGVSDYEMPITESVYGNIDFTFMTEITESSY